MDSGRGIETDNFVLPITKNGKKHMLIRGSKGKLDGSLASVTGARITIYRDPNDGGNLHIFSPKCTVDQATQKGGSDKKVNVRSDPIGDGPDSSSEQIIMDGLGYDFEFPKEEKKSGRSISIRSAVKVRIFRRKTAEELGTEEAGIYHTIITSKTMSYDLDKDVITFRDDVHAMDFNPAGKKVFEMNADTMDVVRDEEGNLRQVNAEGAVICRASDGRVTAAKAVYDYTAEEATFSGEPVLHLKDGTQLVGAAVLLYNRNKKFFAAENDRPKLVIPGRADDRNLFKDLNKKGKDEQ